MNKKAPVWDEMKSRLMSKSNLSFFPVKIPGRCYGQQGEKKGKLHHSEKFSDIFSENHLSKQNSHQIAVQRRSNDMRNTQEERGGQKVSGEAEEANGWDHDH